MVLCAIEACSGFRARFLRRWVGALFVAGFVGGCIKMFIKRSRGSLCWRAEHNGDLWIMLFRFFVPYISATCENHVLNLALRGFSWMKREVVKALRSILSVLQN